MTFLVAIVVGSLALTLPVSSASGSWTPPLIAFSTATSAVTVTGLIWVDTATYWSAVGHVVILILVQLGGLGFMTGASLAFILLGRRLTLQERLLVREAVGAFTLGDAVQVARRVAEMTFICEGIGAAVLFVAFTRSYSIGEAIWLATFHAVSAFNNAGFDLFGNFRSLVDFQHDPVVLLTIATLVAVGGLSYVTVADLFGGRSPRQLALDTKIVLVSSVALWILGTLAVLGAEWHNPGTLGPLDWPAKVLNALFHSVSSRSAGFTTLDIAQMTDQSLFLTVGLMFIGGASASTAGGIRVNTFSVLLAAILAAASGRRAVQAFGRTIPVELVNRALSIALLSVAFVFAVSYLLALVEQHSFLSLLFEATSAFGTAGMGTGVTPTLSPIGSVIVVLTMIVGRLGPLTLAVILAGRLDVPHVRYAPEAVRIG